MKRLNAHLKQRRANRYHNERGNVLIVAVTVMGILILTSGLVALSIVRQDQAASDARYSSQSAALAQSTLNYVYSSLEKTPIPAHTLCTPGTKFLFKSPSATCHTVSTLDWNSLAIPATSSSATTQWVYLTHTGAPALCHTYKKSVTPCVRLHIAGVNLNKLPTITNPTHPDSITIQATAVAGCTSKTGCAESRYQGQLINRSFVDYTSFTQYETLAPALYNTSAELESNHTAQWSWNCNVQNTASSDCINAAYIGTSPTHIVGYNAKALTHSSITSTGNLRNNQTDTITITKPSSAPHVQAVQIHATVKIISSSSGAVLLIGSLTSTQMTNAVHINLPTVASQGTAPVYITTIVSTQTRTKIGFRLLSPNGTTGITIQTVSTNGYFSSTCTTSCNLYDNSRTSTTLTTSISTANQPTSISLAASGCPSNSADAAEIRIHDPSSAVLSADPVTTTTMMPIVGPANPNASIIAALTNCTFDLESGTATTKTITIQVLGYYTHNLPKMGIYTPLAKPILALGSEAQGGSSISSYTGSPLSPVIPIQITGQSTIPVAGIQTALITIDITANSTAGTLLIFDGTPDTTPAYATIPITANSHTIQLAIPVDGTGTIWMHDTSPTATAAVQISGYYISQNSDSVTGALRTNSPYILYCGHPTLPDAYDSSGEFKTDCSTSSAPPTSPTISATGHTTGSASKIQSLQLPTTSNLASLETAAGPYVFPSGTNIIGGTCTSTCPSTKYTNHVIAGTNAPSTATAELDYPGSIITTHTGDVYIADTGANRILMIPRVSGSQFGQSIVAGHTYTIAGNGTAGYTSTQMGGPAINAELDAPASIAVYDGNLYIADTRADRVLMVPGSSQTYFGQSMTGGDIYNIAGDGSPGPTGVGFPADEGNAAIATSADVGQDYGIAVDNWGVFISDSTDNRVDMLPISTGTYYGQSMTANDLYEVIGNMSPGSNSQPGTLIRGFLGTSSSLYGPLSLAINNNHDLFVANSAEYSIAMLAGADTSVVGQTPTVGDVYNVAGNGAAGHTSPAVATSSELEPSGMTTYADGNGIALSPASNLYITDGGYVQMVPTKAGVYFGQDMSAGSLYTIAGTATSATATLGRGRAASAATLALPEGIAVLTANNLYVSTLKGQELHLIPDTIRSLSGSENTNAYLGQTMDNNDIYTMAGNGVAGYVGGNPLATVYNVGDGASPLKASLKPSDTAVTTLGTYIADSANDQIRFIPTTSGVYYGQKMLAADIYTIAGAGTPNTTGFKASALSSALTTPNGIVVQTTNVYISETSKNSVTVVKERNSTPLAAMATNCAVGDFCQLGSMPEPFGLAIYHDNLYVADSSATAGKVYIIPSSTTTLFGTAVTKGTATPIAATATKGLNHPTGIAVNGSDLFIAATGNGQIDIVANKTGTQYKVSLTQDILTPIAGGGASTLNGVSAKTFSLSSPNGVSVDNNGDVWIANTAANQIDMLPVASGSYFGENMTEGGIYIIPDGAATPTIASTTFNSPTAVSVQTTGGLITSVEVSTSAQVHSLKISPTTQEDTTVDHTGALTIVSPSEPKFCTTLLADLGSSSAQCNSTGVSVFKIPGDTPGGDGIIYVAGNIRKMYGEFNVPLTVVVQTNLVINAAPMHGTTLQGVFYNPTKCTNITFQTLTNTATNQSTGCGLLGMVAGKNIVIRSSIWASTVAPANPPSITIQGVLETLGKTMYTCAVTTATCDGFQWPSNGYVYTKTWADPFNGTPASINLQGGIIGQYRFLFGTYVNHGTTNPLLQTGYGKNLSWDPRLANTEPPGFLQLNGSGAKAWSLANVQNMGV